jgi:hypothetical protein
VKVEARRDDGALLVTEGPAAVVVLDDRAWVTSRDSALARGSWEPASGDVPEAATAKADDLAAFRTELDEQQTRP